MSCEHLHRPAERLNDLADKLGEVLDKNGMRDVKPEIAFDECNLDVPADKLLAVARILRDSKDLAFEQLIDVCGIDYLSYGNSEWNTETATDFGFSRGVDRAAPAADDANEKRFAVIYHLLSVEHNLRIRLRVYAEGEPPRVPSVTEIWNAADWFEREAFDLYGILFMGHKDLRRILTDYGFVGHPFRKDFPLIGEVEMRYDEDKKPVVYEPVSIEPRTLVPRVIRDDNRYNEGDARDEVN